MSSPPPPVPGETPEQRQARFAAAAAVQNRIDQQARDEEARRAAGQLAELQQQHAAMVAATPQPVSAPSLAAKPAVNDPDFDINIAMNTFSKQLGERVRSGQMTVADAQRAQAQMRALQVNPAMANRAAATEIAQRALQVGPYHPSNIAAQQAAQQPATSAVSNYIANMNAPTSASTPAPMRNVANPQSHISDFIANMNAPASPAQATAFDRNAGLQQLNTEFGRLRNEYGDDALRGVGFTPSVLQGLQSTMRGLQLDNSSTQDQHNAAMGQVMATLRGYANQLKPVDVVPKRPAELPSVELPSVKPGGSANFNESTGAYTPSSIMGIGSLLSRLSQAPGDVVVQPKFVGQNFTGDAPPPGMKYIETGEGLVPVPINDMPVKPATGPGIGASIGAPMMGPAMQPQGMTLNNVPQQLTLSNLPMKDAAPQPMLSNLPMTQMLTGQPGPPPMFQPGPPIQTTPMSQPMPQGQPTPVQGMYRGGFAVR